MMLSLEKILGRYSLKPAPKSVEIDEYLRSNLSPYRYEHSLKVLEFALDLAVPVTDMPENEIAQNQHPVDLLSRLTLAALAHDITKEQPPEFHLELFKKYQRPDYAELPRTLFHSKSAVFLLAEKFHVKDEMVSHAISYHSTGCTDMPRFSRIIFCADYLATKDHTGGRDAPPSAGPVDTESLTRLCLEKITATITWLLGKKLPVQPESINFYNILVKEMPVSAVDL